MRVPHLFFLVVCAAVPVEAQQTSGVSRVSVHAGVAHAALTDTEFEIVPALSGQDLFRL